MSRKPIMAWTVLFLALAPSAFGAERIHGLGVALNLASLEVEDVPGSGDFRGFSAFGKVGLTENWGFLVSFRDLEIDEDLAPGEDESYQQIALHALYMWRSEKTMRPHVKFGLARTSHKLRDPVLGSLIDDGLGFSVGGGLEAGSQKIAFFGDLEFTRVKLFDLNFDTQDLTIGIIFKF